MNRKSKLIVLKFQDVLRWLNGELQYRNKSCASFDQAVAVIRDGKTIIKLLRANGEYVHLKVVCLYQCQGITKKSDDASDVFSVHDGAPCQKKF